MDHNPRSSDEEAEIDREIRTEKMKQELERMAEGKMVTGSFGPVSTQLEEAFIRQVLAVEQANWDTPFDRLARLGVNLVPAAELDDPALRAKLSEVVHKLAELRCFLYDTNHLDDRELYDWLYSCGLREESPNLSNMAEGAWHTSPIGAGTDEDTAISLKYYANDDERAWWQTEFPDDPLPARESLPFDRDRFLPKARDF
jgi:hypothetical protein